MTPDAEGKLAQQHRLVDRSSFSLLNREAGKRVAITPKEGCKSNIALIEVSPPSAAFPGGHVRPVCPDCQQRIEE